MKKIAQVNEKAQWLLEDVKPKLWTTLRHYDRKQFMTDLMAGVIVGIVALPLAIAFGIASGVTPEKGIITAIVAGLLVSVLGGSKVQIGGPTGAFIIIIYGIGRCVPHHVWCAPSGHHHQVYPLSHRGRLHQWYCRHHLHHADQGSFRSDDGEGAQRLH